MQDRQKGRRGRNQDNDRGALTDSGAACPGGNPGSPAGAGPGRRDDSLATPYVAYSISAIWPQVVAKLKNRGRRGSERAPVEVLRLLVARTADFWTAAVEEEGRR